MARRKTKPRSGRKSTDKRLERFKETARMLGIDENSETFARAFAKLESLKRSTKQT